MGPLEFLRMRSSLASKLATDSANRHRTGSVFGLVLTVEGPVGQSADRPGKGAMRSFTANFCWFMVVG